MKIVFVGNCHVDSLAKIANYLCPFHSYKSIRISGGALKENEDLISDSDLIVSMSTFMPKVKDFLGEAGINVNLHSLPHVIAWHFHPDLTMLRDSEGKNIKPLGSPVNSKIIFSGWKQGVPAQDVLKYFNKYTYGVDNCIKLYRKTQKWLDRQAELTGYRCIRKYTSWHNSTSYVFTPHHPKAYVFVDILIEFFEKIGEARVFKDAELLTVDKATKSIIMPPLVSFGEKGLIELPIENALIKPPGKDFKLFDMKEFAEESYNLYEEVFGDRFSLDESEYPFINLLERRVKNMPNPYLSLPETNFWKKSVSQVRCEDLDPVVEMPWKIDKNQVIATAGSCFAQHISKKLIDEGFCWMDAEKPPKDLSLKNFEELNYGVFSARYGNVYTSKQLVDLIKRAVSQDATEDFFWDCEDDGSVVDPFRPFIKPGGYQDYLSMLEDRRSHLACVKRMFESLDVFVFTLGLTECWQNIDNGFVVPFHPGVAKCAGEAEKYKFCNLTVGEVIEDLTVFNEILTEVNPSSKVLLTVSPVPLIASFNNDHVVNSNSYSKSVLRVAAQTLVDKMDNFSYFPSYEIITGNFSKGRYFKPDFREVTEEGVAHVMQLMKRHLLDTGKGHERDGPLGNYESFEFSGVDVVCDEEKGFS